MSRWLVGGLLLSAAGLGYGYWLPGAGWFEAGERYKTQALSRGDVVSSVAANGSLNPLRLLSVGTRVSGTVKRLRVDYNQRVEQGQVLLELDDALYAAQLKQSQAGLAMAEAGLALAEADERRIRDLIVNEFATRQQLDQAVQARKAAAAQVEAAQAAVQKDRGDLADTVIRAPVSGIVIERLVEEGQTVAANFQTPTLITIAEDLTKMQIDASFAESYIGDISPGQRVQFSVDAFPERSFSGRVAQVRLNPLIDQNVVTYDVVILADNPDLLLFPGMTAYVNITLRESKGALLVPNAALRFKATTSQTHTAKQKPALEDSDSPQRETGRVQVLNADGTLRAVEVALGISDNRVTELLSGELKPGDAVVIGKIGEPDAVAGATQRRSSAK